MVLESTFICVDNSEFMRNGDFLPTRLQAQQDAVSMITQSKLRSNPESNVGLMTLGSLEVLVTLTTDSGKIMAKLHGVQPKGDMMLVSGIKIAHLALKHRLSKNHKTRIVAFVGSPVGAEFEKELIKLAKKLKKEKVSVDVVSFGEVDANEGLLKKFVETVNGKDGTASHLVAIPPGPHLSDALISSPILQGEDGAGGVMMMGSAGGFEFGVDPNEDPELALALRVSMEEQRARQEQQGSQPSSSSNTKSDEAATSEADTQGGSSGNADEAMLEKALKMSMETNEPDLASMTEEEQIAYAMKMSMQGSDDVGMDVDDEASEKAGKDDDDDDDADEDYSEAMNDPAFLQSVLESLPGVDPQSEAVKLAMGAMAGSKDKKKGGSDPKDGKKDDNDEKDQSSSGSSSGGNAPKK